jgi:hypothetical protein
MGKNGLSNGAYQSSRNKKNINLQMAGYHKIYPSN